jgi:hypothetical protein
MQANDRKIGLAMADVVTCYSRYPDSVIPPTLHTDSSATEAA